MVTFITDEEDAPIADLGSAGDPDTWYQAVLEAKNGNPDAMVTLGLYGMGCPPFDPNTGEGAQEAPRLDAFVDRFKHARKGQVCAADYSPFFQDAVNIIDEACDVFVPPG